MATKQDTKPAVAAEENADDEKDQQAVFRLMERIKGKPHQLHAKIADIMMIAERIPKRGRAPQAMGNFPFVQVGDAADFIRKALGRRNISMTPTKVAVVGKSEHATSKGGTMTTIELVVTWTLTDGETDESTVIETYGAGADTGDKFSGKAMTNAMKYAFLSGFQLSTGEDVELNDTTDRQSGDRPRPTVASSNGRTPEAGGRQQDASSPQLAQIGTLLRQMHITKVEDSAALLARLTGSPIELDPADPAGSLSKAMAGLAPAVRGKLLHDLRLHAEGQKGGTGDGSGGSGEPASAAVPEAPVDDRTIPDEA